MTITMDEYTLNLAHWINRYPFEKHRDKLLSTNWNTVFGVAILEQFKRRLRDRFGSFVERPVDILVWGLGEPERRDVTKIGGLPYRPAGLTWPTMADGTPIGFLAQFRITESADHVGATPSDILLIFFKDDQPGAGECTDSFYFEWHPLGVEGLIQVDEMPVALDVVTCYGVRHRTTEIDDPRVIEYVEEVVKSEYPGQEDWEWQRYRHVEYICHVEDSKIGGQPELHPRYTPTPIGRHLGSLHAFYEPCEIEYPWINQPEPKSIREISTNQFDISFDCGFFTFYLDERDQVRCTLAVPP